MHVALLANRHAGRGRGGRVADRVAAAVSSGGHTIELVPVGPGACSTGVAARIAAADVVAAAGGDGTVLHAARVILGLASAARAGQPALYHLPCGNENLFARDFGMTREPDALVRALAARVIRRVDVGAIAADGATPNPFLIMASVGPDASVIHRLARSARRLSGHAAYVGPVVAELRSPAFPSVRVRMDGRRMLGEPAGGNRGILVVANSRRYALRLDPAVRASMEDGVLDAVFLPCESRLRALWWAVRCRLGRHLADSAARYERGVRVEVDSADGLPLPVQVDGEAFAPAQEVRSLFITVSPAALPVLMPA